MSEFRMPSLGADMETGTLVEWLIKPGDQVNRGDVVAVVETQKGSIDVEIFESGVVEEIIVAQGTEVPVGTVLARIGAAARVQEPSAPTLQPDGVTAQAVPAVPAAKAPALTEPARLRVSPLARRRAEELGVDLTSIRGTRPSGAISVHDVEQAASAAAVTLEQPATAQPTPPAPAPSVAAREEAVRARPAAARQTPMRAAIATSMARSNREIPHYYLATDIDMHRVLTWLEAENRKRPVAERLLYAAPLLKAVALAVREVPEVNGFWQDEAFQLSEAVHLGVAISLRQGGLVAPAIQHADLQSVDELMANLRDLIMRARTGKLRSSEIAGPTLTVTSVGEQGVPTVFGVVYPPQVALVGFGLITERPWAVNGLLGVRPVVTATLAADHRVSDGHRGGLFLAAIDRLLQEPEKL